MNNPVGLALVVVLAAAVVIFGWIGYLATQSPARTCQILAGPQAFICINRAGVATIHVPR